MFFKISPPKRASSSIPAILMLFSLTLLAAYREQPTLAQSEDGSNLLTYTNTNLGFTFQYPSSWKLHVDDEQTRGFFTLYSADNVSSVLIHVGPIERNYTGLSLEQYAIKYTWDIPSFVYGNVKPIEVNTNTYYLSGHRAARIIETMSSSNHLKQMSLVLPLNNKQYAVDYIAPTDQFSNYLQQAQAIMDSFQLINKQ